MFDPSTQEVSLGGAGTGLLDATGTPPEVEDGGRQLVKSPLLQVAVEGTDRKTLIINYTLVTRGQSSFTTVSFSYTFQEKQISEENK